MESYPRIDSIGDIGRAAPGTTAAGILIYHHLVHLVLVYHHLSILAVMEKLQRGRIENLFIKKRVME